MNVQHLESLNDIVQSITEIALEAPDDQAAYESRLLLAMLAEFALALERRGVRRGDAARVTADGALKMRKQENGLPPNWGQAICIRFTAKSPR